jgi:hypothetical protein
MLDDVLRVTQRLDRCEVGLALLATVVVACGPARPAPAREVIISASDYAFQVAHEMPAGPVIFKLENRGRVPHEMALGQLRAGITADSVLTRVAAGGDPDDLTDGIVGILITEPGTTSLGSLRADLVPGRTYMMICQFRDADSLPPHIALGMHASFVAQ